MHSMQTRVALAKIIDNSPRSTPNQIIAALIAKIISLLLEKFLEFIFVALDVRADYRSAYDFALAVYENRSWHRLDARKEIQQIFIGNNVHEVRAGLPGYFLRFLDLTSCVLRSVTNQPDNLRVGGHGTSNFA